MGRHRKRRIGLAVVIAVAVLLVGARIYAPIYLEDRINDAIAESPDYRGRVEDVDMQLWRGGFQIEGIHLEATTPNTDFASIDARRLDISLSWPALMDGVVASELDLVGLRAVVTRRRLEEVPEEKPRPLAERLKDATPFQLDRVQIHDGVLEFVDVEDQDTVYVGADQVEATIHNLTNRAQLEGGTFARAEATARIAESGTFESTVRFDPLADSPTFDVNASVEGLSLPKLNEVFRGYLGMDVESGRADLFVEAATEDGRFEGYVKPVVKDLEVFSLTEEQENVGQFLKEAVTDLAAEVLENQRKDQVATQVRISGRLQNPEAGMFDAVVGVIENAFIRAIVPRLERTIDLGDVAGDGGSEGGKE